MVAFDYTFDVILHIRWPLFIAMYIFFAGMSAGSFILSTLGNVFGIKQFKPLSRIGVVVALVLLMLAMLFLIIDLAQPMKAYTTLYYINPNSVMTWGVYLLTVYAINGLVYCYFVFRADFARLAKRNARRIIPKTVYSALTLERKGLSTDLIKRDARFAKLFGIIGVIIAIMVCTYTGFILAVVQASALWHTALMPLLFLASTVVSALALFIIVNAIYTRYFSREKKVDRKTLIFMAEIMAWAQLVDLTLIICIVIILYNIGSAASDTAWLLTQGPLSFMFIGVQIMLGAILPKIILFIPASGKRLWGQLLASGFILVGIMAMRFNIIIGGQFVPPAGGEVIKYNISHEELLTTLMVVFLGVLLIYVAFKIIPLRPLIVGADKNQRTKADSKRLPARIVADQPGLSRRAFLRAAMAIGGLIGGIQLGLLGLWEKGSQFGSAEPLGATGKGKPARYAMVIDLTRCMGCHSCTQACKTTYDQPTGVWRSWVSKIRKTDGRNEKNLFLPRLCNHCDNPPCVNVCPVLATYKNENGVVLQRYERCIGCKYCMMACPYGMRYLHPVFKVVDKCTFCQHRTKKGLKPACVAACPAGARIFGDLNDNTSEVSMLVTTKHTTVLKPSLGTEPMVYYIGGDKDLMESGIHRRE